ncbi:MAG: phosphomannomutase/phosphoglucomutase [Thermoleophilaceae bacterium]|nr:phosphomannomutase/phosphoglucomutase [Thermoleophilaceae bacterium]
MTSGQNSAPGLTDQNTTTPALDASIFKAYDIRGTYPDQINAGTAYAIGRGFAQVLADRYGQPTPAGLKIALGRDMRLSAPELAAQYRQALVDEGCEVTDIGQVASEMLYWIVNQRELDGGLMCTASHNPKAYTGAKLVARKSIPLSGDEGIQEIREKIEAGIRAPSSTQGSATELDIYSDFHSNALTFIDKDVVTARRVVCDGGNGMAGPMLGPIFDKLPLDLATYYWQPDGDFPDHEPNPLLPENRQFIIDKLRESGAELGIAWDGDADRCFFIDETGTFVDGDFLTALLAESLLRKNPGATILYDVRASRAVQDTVERAGGTALVNRVGHAFFKVRMHETGAVFGGEVSGHYYFRDFGNVDSGTLPALYILELLSQEGKTLGELLAPYRERYFITGEINSTVSDSAAVIAEIERRYGDAEITKLDGISVDYPDWHFNVRASNTEPLLRLNLEAFNAQQMETKRDELLELIRA